MTETSALVAPIPAKGLMSRVVGVLFSPRETYPAVVAQPRVLGAFVVTRAVMAACQLVTVTDEMARQMESRLSTAPRSSSRSTRSSPTPA